MPSPLHAAREKYRSHGITIIAAPGEYRVKHDWDDDEYITDDFADMIARADRLVANPPPKPPPPPGPEARSNHPRAVARRTNKKNSKTLRASREQYEKDLVRWKAEQQ